VNTVTRIEQLNCFSNATEIQPLGGGITNLNFTVRDGTNRYVVRIGDDIPEHGVMRWNELALSQAAEAVGISPAVVYHEPGVLVLDFLEARTFSEEDVRDPANLTRTIDLVASVHSNLGSHLISPILTFWPYQVNRTYVTRLLAQGTNHATLLPELMAEQDKLAAATGPVNLVIGHNDLLAANIMDDGERLWLIDWEYGGFNTPLFDLAGLAGNNGLSEQQEQGMLEQYFSDNFETNWRPYQAMKCASLMRETLWSMVSEQHSKIDFDYAGYTAENLARLRVALNDFANT